MPIVRPFSAYSRSPSRWASSSSPAWRSEQHTMPAPGAKVASRSPAASVIASKPSYRPRRAPVTSALYEVRTAALASREPPARDGLLARIELDRVGPVRVQVAEERVLPAAEREERDGSGDAD